MGQALNGLSLWPGGGLVGLAERGLAKGGKALVRGEKVINSASHLAGGFGSHLPERALSKHIRRLSILAMSTHVTQPRCGTHRRLPDVYLRASRVFVEAYHTRTA